VATTRAEDGHK